MNDKELTSIAFQAEKLKFRRVGIPIKTQKPHGFAEEWVANTDGISKYLKFTHEYYVSNEAKRAEERAELLKQEAAIKEKLKQVVV